MSSPRLSLRALAVITTAAGALLAPAAVAVADSSPTPVVSLDATVKPSPSEKVKRVLIDRAGTTDGRPGADKATRPAVMPRGGVAAGEKPTAAAGSDSGVNVPLLAASTGLLLAGAGIVVIRRRNAADGQV
ncbi:hypothetical protein ABZ348_22240 [Streptomyces sp. NPDC005963]|uniref:hypothetical protein n=1 Tax=Streptomyces sp. NPDC005963 TaxID=3156721 RepID=UPI0033F414AC